MHSSPMQHKSSSQIGDSTHRSPHDSPFASTRRNLRQKASIMRPHFQTSNFKLQTSRGVTVVEVLFAMFVILFGLVGLAAIIPMAARQANDSYAMVHGAASMENLMQEFKSRNVVVPTEQQPWWLPNDYLNDPVTGNANTSQAESLSFKNMDEIYSELRKRVLWEQFNILWPNSGTASPTELARSSREGLAQGFCIDPVFCAVEFSDGWHHSTTYTNVRGSATQGFMRRSRMPFYDEGIELVTSGTDVRYSPQSNNNYPRLMRASYHSGFNAAGAPRPVVKALADIVGLSGVDLLQDAPQEDKSYGALRGFQSVGGTLVASNSNVGSVSWMITMTPTENTSPGMVPTSYDVSTVVFNGRDRMFDAVPFSVSGAEEYSRAEKLCFATANAGSNALASTTLPQYTAVSELPVSSGGPMTVKLWSDAATNTNVRIGDWIMLSRRIELSNVVDGMGNLSFPNDYKVVHRHRWYRVTGIDNSEKWPRVIRLDGEPWDYPELGAANTIQTISNALATTATIVPNVVAVHSTITNITSN